MQSSRPALADERLSKRGSHPFDCLLRPPQPPTAALPTDYSGTLFSHASLVAQIGIDQPLAYPASKGSLAILLTIASVARAGLTGPRPSVSNPCLLVGWQTRAINSQPAPDLLFHGVRAREIAQRA